MSEQTNISARPSAADFARPEDMARLSPLGRCLEANRKPERCAMWRMVMFGLLALLVILNVLVPNHHPHFEYDKYPGFWPIFSFVMGTAMIFFVKKIYQPLIKRPEDYYGDL